MKTEIDYKVPNGKLLRLEIDIDQKVIKNIKITGDFFIHPETSIIEIESLLKETNLNAVKEKLLFFLKENNVQIIGFTVSDLVYVLEGLKNE